MKIAVFGTGVVGQTIAEKLSQLGHQVMVGTRNPEDSLARSGADALGRLPFGQWYASHKQIELGTFSKAAKFGELIVNATNGMGTMPALESAGRENLEGKVLLDISNPLDFSKGMPPTLFVSNTDSLGEQVQRAYPGTRVVKSLNTVNAYVMVNPGQLPDDTNIFLSGNDAGAKSKVKELLVSMGWKEKDILDLGDISTARGAEQILPIWVRLMMTLNNPLFNFKNVQGPPPPG